MTRFAVLSYHTSPLAQPGTGDGGGMNVYVRELSSALARLGHDVDVFTRHDGSSLSDVVSVEPGFRVHFLDAGPRRVLERDELSHFVGDFTNGLRASFLGQRPDVIHANYWLSGVAGHELKHEFGIPLVMTFHTCERVKAEVGIFDAPERDVAEAQLFQCADAVLASCDVEAQQFIHHYEVDASRLHEVPLGVDHAFFAPGFRPQARRALGLAPDDLTLLFVGRIQDLKGPDLALDTLLELRRRGRDAVLYFIGGPSGPGGSGALAALHERAAAAQAQRHVHFVAPQGHQLLSSWMRAADVTLVPSRSESFGLVALESSACGTPVVASAVGGLTTIVSEGVNGELVVARDARAFADAVERVTHPDVALALSNQAVLRARTYTWRAAANIVAQVAGDLPASTLCLAPGA